MKSAVRSSAVARLRLPLHARLVSIVLVLALALMGLAGIGHAHALELAGADLSRGTWDANDHCPGPGGTDPAGHCRGSIHAHACCILLPVATGHAVGAPGEWGRDGDASGAGIVIAPIPRPPSPVTV